MGPETGGAGGQEGARDLGRACHRAPRVLRGGHPRPGPLHPQGAKNKPNPLVFSCTQRASGDQSHGSASGRRGEPREQGIPTHAPHREGMDARSRGVTPPFTGFRPPSGVQSVARITVRIAPDWRPSSQQDIAQAKHPAGFRPATGGSPRRKSLRDSVFGQLTVVLDGPGDIRGISLARPLLQS